MNNLLKKIALWFTGRKFQVIRFLILSLMWITAAYLPYLNLIFTKELIFFLIFITSFFIFKLSWKVILYSCIAFFFISCILVLFGFLREAELFGNYIYGFLITMVIKFYNSI
ncbi:MAG: hypothetical protein AAB656_01385 [Patescibacteria group bacterium]